MRTRHFLSLVQHQTLHEAIQAAERDTSARMVVYISHRHTADAMEKAHQIFRKLKLETAEEKANLLIFVAPRSQNFAIVGGTALHEKLGQSWWDQLAHELSSRFRKSDYMGGLLAVVASAEKSLKEKFPRGSGLASEHPDIVED